MLIRRAAIVLSLISGLNGAEAQAQSSEFIAGEIARARPYVLRMYTLGPASRADTAHFGASQRRHLEYLFGQRRAGLLTIQGPFLDGGNLRGIGFMAGVDQARAHALALEDPHVKAGYLNVRTFRWLGLPGDSLPHAAGTIATPPPPADAPITPEYIASHIARAQTYVVALYTLGPASRADTAKFKASQEKHLQYLFGLRAKRQLYVHGPLLDAEELRGISIFAGVDEATVRKLASEDPHVQAGYLNVQVLKWMGIPGDRLP